MNKKTIFYIFVLLILSTCKIFAQSTWEYYFRNSEGNDGYGYAEIILNIEELENGDLISTAWRYLDYYHQNDAPALIRLHNGNTGEVYKEVEYSIDTLTPELDWIFYDKDSEIFTIIGAAHYVNIEKKYKRGYFLLTRWDKELNLLKDTIIRLEPIDVNFYLNFFNCNYTQSGDYLIFGKYNKKYKHATAGFTDLLIKIDKTGKILKKKSYKNNVHTGQHSTVIEDKANNGFILLGPHTYFLDNNFEITDSIYVFYDPDSDKPTLPKGIRFNTFHTTWKSFPPDKLLLTSQINDFHRGLAILTMDLEYLKGVELTTKTDPETIELLNGRRSMDFKDTSSIYTTARDWHSHYYTLSRVNSNLEPYWIKYFSENDTIAHVLWSVKATLDGGCVIAGDKGIDKNRDSGLPYKPGAWMKKFDADGNSVGTSDIPKSSWEITVYPNPSQGDFKVDIGGNARDTRLKLFDMQGKLVKTYDNLISGINRLNLQNLSQGMYVWKMEKDGTILGIGKWVKR